MQNAESPLSSHAHQFDVNQHIVDDLEIVLGHSVAAVAAAAASQPLHHTQTDHTKRCRLQVEYRI